MDGFAVRMLVLVADDGPQECELVVQQPRMALGVAADPADARLTG